MKISQIFCVSVVLFLCACTTVQQREAAGERVNVVWGADNRVTRSTLATRKMGMSYDQAVLLAERTLRRIGLGDLNVNAKAGEITGQRRYANSAWSWSDSIKQAEEPRLKQIFMQAIGPQGAFLMLNPIDEILTGTVQLQTLSNNSVRIQVDFRSDNPIGAQCAEGCVAEMPPSALRAAYYEFWRTFDEEFAAAPNSTRRTKRDTRRVPAPSQEVKEDRPPSDWVIPPSDWVVPDK